MFEPLHVIPCERNKRTHVGSLVIFPKHGLPVGEVGNVDVRKPSLKAVAYANLFAAAPDMLAALKQVEPAAQSLMDELAKTKATNWGIVNDCLLAVSAAIRKAEGR